MTYTVVVHEDKQPLVRHHRVPDRKELIMLLSRTHNRMIEKGYALTQITDGDAQRASTYTWARDASTNRDVHVVVLNE